MAPGQVDEPAPWEDFSSYKLEKKEKAATRPWLDHDNGVWQSVSRWLPPRDEHKDYWWNLCGPHVAALFSNAGYSLSAQYEALLFLHHHMVPRMGARPQFNNTAGESLEGDVIEYSWRWNDGDANSKPEVRMIMEPTCRFAGTYIDPLNLDPGTDMLYNIRSQVPSLDMRLFHHMIATLYDDGARHKYLDPETGRRAKETNLCLGFEFLHAKEGDENTAMTILPKAYFFPRKLGMKGLLPVGEWEKALRSAIPGGPIYVIDRVFDFLADEVPRLRLDVKPIWLGVDVVRPANARLKLYCMSPQSSFEDITATIGMNGAIIIAQRHLDAAWELLKNVCALPADFPRNRPLIQTRDGADDNSSNSTGDAGASGSSSFAYYFEMGARRSVPDVKLYVPMRHYGAKDQAIAEALTQWMQKYGRGQYVDAYWDSLRKIVTHCPLSESRGIHVWISIMFTQDDRLQVTSYLRPKAVPFVHLPKFSTES